MSAAVSIRRARVDEADRLTAIAHASKRHWHYPESWLEAWRDDLTFMPRFIADHPVYVAVDSGVESGSATDEAIACYALVGDGPEIQLEHVWVLPSAIGRGIGRALVEHASQTARALGAERLVIDSDPYAEAFYTRLGARRVGAIRADVCGTRRELPRLQLEVGDC